MEVIKSPMTLEIVIKKISKEFISKFNQRRLKSDNFIVSNREKKTIMLLQYWKNYHIFWDFGCTNIILSDCIRYNVYVF